MTEFDLAKKLFQAPIESLARSLAESDLNTACLNLKENLCLSNADTAVEELTSALRLAQKVRTRIAETKTSD